MKFSKTQLDALRRERGPIPRKTRQAEPTMTAAGALEILRTAAGDVRGVLETHRNAQREHVRQVERDDTLTSHGRAVRLAELREQANAATAQAAAELRAAVEEARASIDARARARRPAPAAGLEAMMARQFRWNRVKAMLDADVPLHEVIAETTDPETLHALSEELPAYLRIKGESALAAAEISRAVDDQLAHVTGGKALEAHVAAREAETLAGHLAPLLADVDAIGAGAGSEVMARASIAAARTEYAVQSAERDAIRSVTVPPPAEDVPNDDEGDEDDETAAMFNDADDDAA